MPEARRLTALYDHVVWLNPIPEAHWHWMQSIGMVREIMSGRMYPLTLEGLDRAITALKHHH